MLPTTLTYITLLMIQIYSLKQVPKRNQQKDIKQISLKLVSAIFYQFFFSSNDRPQKLWKMFFISLRKLFLFSRYSNFCDFSLLLYTFQIQKGKWKWNNLWCHKFAFINLQIEFLELTQKPLCITSSNMVR